jgi:hypothetical protein
VEVKTKQKEEADVAKRIIKEQKAKEMFINNLVIICYLL